jgi:nucleoside-diphosphate-sugar epimerase
MFPATGNRVLVTGAGGFVGHHLTSHLKRLGYWVRGADQKPNPYEPTAADEFVLVDLRRREDALAAMRDVHEVYALAADMGGMGFIAANGARLLHNNLLIDVNTIEAAREHGVRRYLYASSACVYPEQRQQHTQAAGLREDDAYPAQPADTYGWEKLLGERLCLDYASQFGMATRIVRMHNIFGPLGAWDGGREKAPAAICRKVAAAKHAGSPEIEVWGDGEQTRSFCYVDDAVEGLHRLMRSDYGQPLNLGQERLISIDGLVDLVSAIAGVTLRKRHVAGPQGVRGRTSDNTRVRAVLGWEPKVPLEQGLAATYAWVEQQVLAAEAVRR